MIIGIAGRQQSDVDAAVNRLQNCGFYHVSFAHNFKVMCRMTMRNRGITQAEINAAESNPAGPIEKMNGRSYQTMLQSLDAWARRLDPDFTVHCAERELAALGNANVVVDDIHHENEAELIRRMGGLVLHIVSDERRAADLARAPSITKDNNLDKVIANNGSIEGLFSRLFLAMEERFGEPA